MILPVTLTIAAAAAVINLWLAFRIVPTRIKDKVLHGDAGNERLAIRMRAQANFVEYAPFVLILLGLVELAGGSPFWLWIIGVVFVLSRIAHGFGMDRPAPNPWRAGGALLTWGVMGAARRLGSRACLSRGAAFFGPVGRTTLSSRRRRSTRLD